MSQAIHWDANESEVVCRSGEDIVFRDTAEHWTEAVLRLLNLNGESGRKWVEAVALESQADPRPFLERRPEERIEVIARGSARVFTCPSLPDPPPMPSEPGVFGEVPDSSWFTGLRDDPSYAVFGNAALQHAMLYKLQDGRWDRIRPVEYEEAYFEGDQLRIGYSSYRQQAGWRLEKAARLVRQIRGVAGYLQRELPPGSRVLDVGSGYGYFRKASTDFGWSTDGVEISAHAGAIARSEFGLDTFVGHLAGYVERQPEPVYDLLTLFDTIEHVEDPVALLRSVHQVLKPGGLCVIRTPNLVAMEAGVFRNHYHSIKVDHIHYFSPSSLCATMQSAGLRPAFVTTESHLLRGFLGPALSTFAVTLRGSDLFTLAQKPA